MMQKKSIFAILGVMLATIVTALALVFTVGPSVGAVDINSDEVVLTEKDFHIKDHVLYGLKQGVADYLDALYRYYDWSLAAKAITDTVVGCGGMGNGYNSSYVSGVPSRIHVQIPEGVTKVVGNYGDCNSFLGRAYYNYDYDYDGDGEIDNIGYGTSCSYLYGPVITVSFPSTLTEIGEYAFYNCDNLTTVTLPTSLRTIGESAFSECDSLTEIVIPAGVESLGNDAFYDCNNLTTVTLPTSLRTIENDAFANCNSLTEIVIPAGVESLGNYAFYNCYNLTTVTLPTSLRTIENDAFANCNSLTEIVIPAGVESLGNYVFNNCSNLTTVTLPASLTTIGSQIFDNCPKLTTINADPSLMADPNLQYYTVGVLNAREHFNIDDNHVLTGLSDAGREIANQHHQVEVTIPDDVVEIRSNNWSSCLPSNAVSVVFSENSELQTIGRYAFYYCDGLTEITIPEHVQSIGEWAFYNCAGLTEITIPEHVQSIGEYAFRSCNNLTTVVIPGNVASIGEQAFYWCDNLTTVEMQSGVREIGSWAFGDCNNLTTVSIPATVTSISSSAFNSCYNLDNIIVEDPATLDLGNLRYYQPIVIDQVADFVFADDGALIGLSDDGIQKKSGHQKSEIVIPESVTVIRGQNGYSFFNNQGIDREIVTFPSALTEIGEFAFAHYQYYYSDDENINTFTIPTGVTTIGDYAFRYSGFEKIIIPEGVTKIGEFAFAGCEHLTSITIPASVTEIGEWCFGAAGANSYGLQEIIVNSPELYNNPNLAIYKRIMVKGYEDSENSNNGNQNHNQNQNNQDQVDNNETTSHEVVSNANKFNPLTAWIGGGIAAGLSVLGVAAMVVAKKRK